MGEALEIVPRRVDEVLFDQDGGELVAYSDEHATGYGLDATAARLLCAVNGEMTVAGMAAALDLEAEVVFDGLVELAGAGLVRMRTV